MKKQLLVILSMICLLAGSTVGFAAPVPVKATAQDTGTKLAEPVKYHRPVAFIVLDKTGQVTSGTFADWRQQVKQAYHIPYYSINDTAEVNQIAQEVIRAEGKGQNKITMDTLRKIAEKSQCEVVTVMVIDEMEEQILNTIGGGGAFDWDGPEEFIRVWTSADLYVYKTAGDKFMRSIVRENNTTELSLETKPETVIKYAMRRLVNKMENRQQI